MHGVKREKANGSADAKAARKQKEAAKLQAYLGVEKQFFDMVSINHRVISGRVNPGIER